MKNHESTLENHENQAKIVTNKNIKKHCQRLWSPKNRISSDGNMCPRKSVSPSFEKKDHRHCIATKIWWSFKSSRDQDVDDDNNTQSSLSLMSGESDIADGVRPFHHPHVWTSNCCDRSHSSLQGYYNLHPYHSFSSSRLLSPSSCQSWSRPHLIKIVITMIMSIIVQHWQGQVLSSSCQSWPRAGRGGRAHSQLAQVLALHVHNGGAEGCGE